MNNETQSESLPQPVESAQPSGIARRRLLRAGMAATPVILTLSGRSAMAATDCIGLSPLAWNSLAPGGLTCTPGSHTVTPRSIGETPLALQASTVANSQPGSVKFNAIFGGTDTTKMQSILHSDTNSFTAFFAAAYCNTYRLGTNYAISINELKSLYSNNLLNSEQKMSFLSQTWGIVRHPA